MPQLMKCTWAKFTPDRPAIYKEAKVVDELTHRTTTVPRESL